MAREEWTVLHLPQGPALIRDVSVRKTARLCGCGMGGCSERLAGTVTMHAPLPPSC